jgi:hypothetical protein
VTVVREILESALDVLEEDTGDRTPLPPSAPSELLAVLARALHAWAFLDGPGFSQLREALGRIRLSRCRLVAGSAAVSARAAASRLLEDAGMTNEAQEIAADEIALAAGKAEAAVKALRSGAFDQAIELIGQALPAAPLHTGVLLCAVEVYLLAMRVKGLREDWLAQAEDVLGRLRQRGTADAKRLEMIGAYLEKLKAPRAVVPSSAPSLEQTA